MASPALPGILAATATVAALTTAGGAALWAAGQTAPPPPAPPPAHTATAAPAHTPTVAERTLTGSASRILHTAGIKAEPANPADLPGWACAAGPVDWTVADAATGTVPGAAATETVTATRPGHAETVFTAWHTALSGCGTVTDSGDDTNQFSWHAGTRTLTVARHGDVLTFSAVAGSGAVAATLAEAANTWAAQTLPAVCANPDNSGAGQTGRDPYGGTYTGYTVDVSVAANPTDPLNAADVARLSTATGTPTWTAPSPTAHPDLAVGTAIPTFIDPDTISAPTAADPGDVGDPPGAPGGTDTATTVTVPVIDTVGPGCGWAFNAVAAPVVNPDTVAAADRAAWLAGLGTLAATQGNWFTAWIGWPAQVHFWQVGANTAADWNTYRTALADANDAADSARARRQRWIDSLTSPTPSPTPTRTAAPAPVYTSAPLPTFTPEPVPTPTYTPEPVPTPTYTPEPVPTPTYTPEPVPTPTYTPEPVPTPTPTYTPEPTPTPTPTPTATGSPAGGASADTAAP